MDEASVRHDKKSPTKEPQGGVRFPQQQSNEPRRVEQATSTIAAKDAQLSNNQVPTTQSSSSNMPHVCEVKDKTAMEPKESGSHCPIQSRRKEASGGSQTKDHQTPGSDSESESTQSSETSVSSGAFSNNADGGKWKGVSLPMWIQDYQANNKNYLTVPGKHLDSRVNLFDGFVYFKSKISDSEQHENWRCSNGRCPGTAILYPDFGRMAYPKNKSKDSHTCWKKNNANEEKDKGANDDIYLLKALIKYDVQHDLRQSERDIFERWANSPLAGTTGTVIKWENNRKAVQEQRKRAKPQLPSTPEGICEHLLTNSMDKTFGEGMFDGGGYIHGSHGCFLLLINEVVLGRARRDVHISLTGKHAVLICPREFECSYFVTCQTSNGDLLLACILLSKASRWLYHEAFNELRERMPNVCVRSALLDGEKNAIAAMKQVWPMSKIRLCQTHFAQSVFHRMCELGLQSALSKKGFRDIAERLMAIPHLPSSDIIRGIQETLSTLKSCRHLTAAEKEAIAKVKEYIDHDWLDAVGVDSLSCHRERHRTAITLHAYLKVLRGKFPKTLPSTFDFAMHLQKMVTATASNDKVLSKEVSTALELYGISEEQRNEIFVVENEYGGGKINLSEFLHKQAFLNPTKEMMRSFQPNSVAREPTMPSMGMNKSSVFDADRKSPIKEPLSKSVRGIKQQGQIATNKKRVTFEAKEPMMYMVYDKNEDDITDEEEEFSQSGLEPETNISPSQCRQQKYVEGDSDQDFLNISNDSDNTTCSNEEDDEAGSEADSNDVKEIGEESIADKSGKCAKDSFVCEENKVGHHEEEGDSFDEKSSNLSNEGPYIHHSEVGTKYTQSHSQENKRLQEDKEMGEKLHFTPEKSISLELNLSESNSPDMTDKALHQDQLQTCQTASNARTPEATPISQQPSFQRAPSPNENFPVDMPPLHESTPMRSQTRNDGNGEIAQDPLSPFHHMSGRNLHRQRDSTSAVNTIGQLRNIQLNENDVEKLPRPRQLFADGHLHHLGQNVSKTSTIAVQTDPWTPHVCVLCSQATTRLGLQCNTDGKTSTIQQVLDFGTDQSSLVDPSAFAQGSLPLQKQSSTNVEHSSNLDSENQPCKSNTSEKVLSPTGQSVSPTLFRGFTESDVQATTKNITNLQEVIEALEADSSGPSSPKIRKVTIAD